MKNIAIVSLNGDDNSGGVERVVFYLKKILREQYSVFIMSRNGRSRKFDKIFYPLLFSIKLFFIKDSITISNSWQSFLFPVDFSIHHGTTAGYLKVVQAKSIGASYIAWMEKISARQAKTVIAVSKNCKRELEEIYKIDPKKIIVVNNFVDEKLFFPEERPDHDNIRILFSGRLEDRKGLPQLLNLASYVESISGFEIILAINSKINCELFSNFKKTSIYYNLDIPAMRKFYSSGDIFYFPTNYEGFSMATLEALSSGIPVIGTKFAIPEELDHYDFVGIFEDGDLRSLISEIQKMTQKNKSRRHEIHKIITRDFGCEQYKNKLLSIFTNTK
jgi:glycosyltransferase involved in cell wall biosynthesis